MSRLLPRQIEVDKQIIEIDSQVKSSPNNAELEKPMRILHVDDDNCILEITKQILEMNHNFQIESTTSVKEAEEKLAQQHYDAVISDYEMPEKNGLQFLKELREKHNDIPFIILTGKGREEVAIQAVNLGADFYVNKTGSPETVYGELAHHLIFGIERRRAIIGNCHAAITLQNLSEAIVTSDAAFRIRAWNKAAEEMFGWKANEVIGKGFKEIFTNIQVSPSFLEVTSTVLEKDQFCGEIVYRHRSGNLRNAELNGITIRDKSNKLVGTVAVCHDITQRKKAEGTLQKSREEYRQLVENLQEGVWVIDEENKTTYVNPRMAEMLEYTQDEMIGKHLFSFMDQDSTDLVSKMLKKRREGDTRQFSYEFCFRAKSGRKVYAEIKTKPDIDEKGQYKGIVSTVTDITNRKENEEALKNSEEKYRSLFENARDTIYTHDLDGNIASVNKAVEEYGLQREQVAGKKVFDFVPKEYWNKLFSQFKLLAQGKSIEGEVEIITPLGKRKAEYRSNAIFQGQKIVGAQTILRDITERAKVAEDLAKERDKLNVIGNFTRHDIRNKLAAINGSIYLAKRNASDNSKLLENLNYIETASRNINRTLEFAKIYEILGNQKLAPVDVGTAMTEAASLFNDFKGVKIVNNCDGFKVLADSVLTAVFHNLIDNSLKYGEKITQIKVSAKTNEDESKTITYEDDGIGIEAKTKEKLFTCGFGKGTGYGLYLIKRSCDIYGWSVKETGEFGKGARFEINIPAETVKSSNL